MSSVHFEKQILDAIDTIVKDSVSKADYDKTIKATIVSCLDATVGKYRVKYQDSFFEAYSNNTNVNYSEGNTVYILIPKNDMTQTKIILNSVIKEVSEYENIGETEDYYEICGGNAIEAPFTTELCSYGNDKIITLYNRDEGINVVNFDELSFSDGISRADVDSILCGATFRTELPEEQRKKGNYGITFDIDFKDNIDGSIITKTYTVDINNMKGNPYVLSTATRQVFIFDIVRENYESVKNISLFIKNFPNKGSILEDDIFISNFELYACRALSQKELSSYSLEIQTDKNYFGKLNENINATALVKFGVSVVESNDFSYYWFREDNMIDSTSAEFLTYGGDGWRCLNKYNILDSENYEVSYLPNQPTCSFNINDYNSTTNKFKLVVILNNGTILTKEFIIKNYGSDYNFTIESDSGDTFYYDNGSPTLTVLINGEEDTTNFTYKWAKVDINDLRTFLDETTEYNEEYNMAVAKYNLLQTQISYEDALPAASAESLEEYLEKINKYNNIQRVEKNKIYHVNIADILGYTTYICSIYQNNELITSVSIDLKNILDIEGTYTLNIVNGVQTFNYNNFGVAPTNNSLEKTLDIQPLTFTIIDNNGNSLNEKILNNCNIKWTINENSLIEAEDSGNTILNYSIAEKYDVSKVENSNISLDVEYKGQSLHAETAFSFIKDGEPGTNGTEIICKIVPNTEEKINDYPMITNGLLNYEPETNDKWFKVQLWNSGTLIWEGYDSGNEVNITWSNLKNKYSSSISDPSSISIDGSSFTYNGFNENAANIIKATVVYQNKTYYATIPVITATTTNSSYNVKLIKDTGFRYVMYSSDGQTPHYDNSQPFTLQITQKINGYTEDITKMNNGYKVNYQWTTKGRLYNGNWYNDIHLTINDNDKYQTYITPSNSFTGENVSNAILVTMTQGSVEVAKIHIPIHFYLDRYGIAAINGWDGNSISLNDNEGMILAPQVGAGIKNNDNTFTGILMGSVKESATSNAEQGLFGYSSGVRSIFLDANSGKAVFGQAGSGQIIIDPTQTKKGLIYGGNYVSGTSGMLIDLTTPEIKWGNGKFTINSNGEVTATSVDLTGKITAETGKIAGWTIDGNKLIGTASGNNQIIIDGSGNISNKNGIWSINRDGSASFSNISITAGNKTSGNVLNINDKFKVAYDGKTTITADADITGKITATSGKIAGFTIDGTILKADQVGMCGKNGDEWAFWAGASTGGNSAFHVGHSGDVHCTNLQVTGGSLNINNGRFEVNSSGQLIAKTTDGGYISMGEYSNHPYVSGLNVGDFGVNMHGHGIGYCANIANASGSLNISCNTGMTLSPDGVLYLSPANAANNIYIYSPTYGTVTVSGKKYLRMGDLLAKVYGS